MFRASALQVCEFGWTSAQDVIEEMWQLVRVGIGTWRCRLAAEAPSYGLAKRLPSFVPFPRSMNVAYSDGSIEVNHKWRASPVLI